MFPAGLGRKLCWHSHTARFLVVAAHAHNIVLRSQKVPVNAFTFGHRRNCDRVRIQEIKRSSVW